MNVTSKVRYALRAMIKIALWTEDRPLSVKRITQSECISPIFLEQILNKLKRYGLVKSIRGAGGGFLLKRAPGEITVGDILTAIEEDIQLTPCCVDDQTSYVDCSHTDNCRVSFFWKDMNARIMDLFESYTLERIIKEYNIN